MYTEYTVHQFPVCWKLLLLCAFVNNRSWKNEEYCIILSCRWNQWGRGRGGGAGGRGGGKQKHNDEHKRCSFILTFCSFFSDILPPCLANCQECAEGERSTEKEGVRDKNNSVHAAKKDFYTAIVNEQSDLTFRQSSSIHSHQTTQTTMNLKHTSEEKRKKPHCTYWLSRHCRHSPSRPLLQPAGHLSSWRPASDQPVGSDWLPLSSQCPFPE